MTAPRFRVRTLMIVVALVAIGFGINDLWQRSVAYDELSKVCANRESACRHSARRAQEKGELVHGCTAYIETDPERLRESIGSFTELARHYEFWKRTYRHAARCPWLSAPLDVPEPEWQDKNLFVY